MYRCIEKPGMQRPRAQRDTESPFNTLDSPGNGTFLTVDLISARRQVKRRVVPPPPAAGTDGPRRCTGPSGKYQTTVSRRGDGMFSERGQIWVFLYSHLKRFQLNTQKKEGSKPTILN